MFRISSTWDRGRTVVFFNASRFLAKWFARVSARLMSEGSFDWGLLWVKKYPAERIQNEMATKPGAESEAKSGMRRCRARKNAFSE